MGHLARECPQVLTRGSHYGATLGPTVGDLGKDHKVFVVSDGHQIDFGTTVGDRQIASMGNQSHFVSTNPQTSRKGVGLG